MLARVGRRNNNPTAEPKIDERDPRDQPAQRGSTMGERVTITELRDALRREAEQASGLRRREFISQRMRTFRT